MVCTEMMRRGPESLMKHPAKFKNAGAEKAAPTESFPSLCLFPTIHRSSCSDNTVRARATGARDAAVYGAAGGGAGHGRRGAGNLRTGEHQGSAERIHCRPGQPVRFGALDTCNWIGGRLFTQRFPGGGPLFLKFLVLGARHSGF